MAMMEEWLVCEVGMTVFANEEEDL